MTEHIEVLIVGAGLSGIAAGHYLQTHCPDRGYAIFEGRAALGGTWDLFRYPGVRSDSDMYTLGYSFRPWSDDRAVAGGPAILRYLQETAAEEGIDRRIRFRHRVLTAAWSSAEGRWSLSVQVGEEAEPRTVTCDFLFVCSGYYAYEAGYTPELPGLSDFRGRVVHPQLWPADLDYRDERVIVVGSGATAVTLVPALAEQAAHVTMLQRSPTYMVASPSRDPLLDRLRARLSPAGVARVLRYRNVLWGSLIYGMARARPEQVRRRLLQGVRDELGPGFDVDGDFAPPYNPWDQRLCLVADGDLFRAMRQGKAGVVTGQIERFVADGVVLRDGTHLAADLVVTATGLRLLPLGNIELSVDGRPVRAGETVFHRGTMLSGVPNLACVLGYTNASWTLRAELSCRQVCRVLNHMRKHGHRRCTPQEPHAGMQRLPWFDFSSGYVRRGIDAFPKRGPRAPWHFPQNYLRDALSVRLSAVDDGSLIYA